MFWCTYSIAPLCKARMNHHILNRDGAEYKILQTYIKTKYIIYKNIRIYAYMNKKYLANTPLRSRTTLTHTHTCVLVFCTSLNMCWYLHRNM